MSLTPCVFPDPEARSLSLQSSNYPSGQTNNQYPNFTNRLTKSQWGVVQLLITCVLF